jgi:hypothetical protein
LGGERVTYFISRKVDENPREIVPHP